MGYDIATAAADQGIGTAGNIVNAGLGLVLGGINDRRQLKQQKKLQDLQIAGNMQMTDYNMQKQLQMWKDTSYSAQVEQMEKAGINPGLMYGMSGGGGQTTGNASGNVQGASAPQGGGEAMAMTMAGIQSRLLQAQAAKLEAETENIKGDTANKPLIGENLQADTGLKAINTRIQKYAAEVAGATIEEAIQKLTAESGIMQELNVQAGVKTQVDRATQQAQILTIKAGLTKALLDNEQVKAQTKLTGEQTTAIAQQLAQGWEKLRQSGKQLTYEEWSRAIQQQIADFQTTHPNIEQIKGGLLDELIRGFRKIANIQ